MVAPAPALALAPAPAPAPTPTPTPTPTAPTSVLAEAYAPANATATAHSASATATSTATATATGNGRQLITFDKEAVGIRGQEGHLLGILQQESHWPSTNGLFKLNNMEGLSRLQLFRATIMLAKDHDLLRVFFTMSAEEKKIYVMDLLEHGL
ncbi:hypothetical protein Q3G72_021735 [Acer saccharum]|nr:hypothetical protein Q3G72_021735 [Acer saccharum]